MAAAAESHGDDVHNDDYVEEEDDPLTHVQGYFTDQYFKRSADLLSAIEELRTAFKTGRIAGSGSAALATAKLLRRVISDTRSGELLAGTVFDILRSIGQALAAARPNVLPIHNVCRRVLFFMGEAGEQSESVSHTVSAPATPAPSDRTPLQFLSSDLEESAQPSTRKHDLTFSSLKEEVIESLNQMIEIIPVAPMEIKKKAAEHVHDSEYILVYGPSKIVEGFLLFAAESARRSFHVIVVEAPTACVETHAMAANLARMIPTTVITDASAFAMMHRVNKVILSPSAVLADGGLLARAGTRGVVLAARHFAVPVVVLASLYKLSPVFSLDQDTFNELRSPAEVLSFPAAKSLVHAEVINPAYDYITADLVSLIITDQESCAPSYIYRMVKDNYDPADRFTE